VIEAVPVLYLLTGRGGIGSIPRIWREAGEYRIAGSAHVRAEPPDRRRPDACTGPVLPNMVAIGLDIAPETGPAVAHHIVKQRGERVRTKTSGSPLRPGEPVSGDA
jgi:hypothetical protein